MAARTMALRMTLAGFLMTCSAFAAAAQDQLPWAEDFAQACQQANAQKKLVLLHFYSDECPPCVRVERNVFSQPEVGAAVGRNYVPVKIHALKNPALATKYHVSQWPTDVFVTPQGLEVMRSISPQTPTAYINLTNSVAASAGIGVGDSSNLPPSTSTVPPPGTPNGPWITGTSRELINQTTSQVNAQASWMTASAATAAQQAQQTGQQAWQTAQGQANQAAANTSQYAQQVQQQAQTASTQAAQNFQQQAQAAAGQAQQVINQYAQPWQAPTAGGWQPPFAGAASTAAPVQPQFVAPAPQAPTPQTPAPQLQAQTVPPATAGFASPYETNPALAPQAPAAAATNYPIAMGGFCPVSLAVERKWKKGQPQFGAVHRRRTFLFTSEAEQKKFLAEPDRYTPVLVGYDPVKFMSTGELVDGSAEFSLTYRKEVYLFANDASLKTFWQNPSQFTEGLRQAMIRTEGNRTLR